MTDLTKGWTIQLPSVSIQRLHNGDYDVVVRGYRGPVFGATSPDIGVAFKQAFMQYLEREGENNRDLIEAGKIYGRNIEA